MTDNQKKKSLDDIVFENKNKDYGAYELRKSEKTYLAIAFIIGAVIFSILILPLFFYYEGKEYTPPKQKFEKELVAEITPEPEETPEEKEEIPEEKIYTIEEDSKGSKLSTLKETPKQDEVAQKKYVGTRVDNSKAEDPTPKQSDLEGNNIGDSDQKGKKTGLQDDNQSGSKSKGLSNAQQQQGDPNAIARNPQKKAKFNGGDWGTFLRKYLNYPQKAEFNEIQGTVNVQFVVNREGKISNLKIIGKKLGYGLEEEAMRVLNKSSGMWTPGEIDGKPVNSYFTQAITFTF